MIDPRMANCGGPAGCCIATAYEREQAQLSACQLPGSLWASSKNTPCHDEGFAGIMPARLM